MKSWLGYLILIGIIVFLLIRSGCNDRRLDKQNDATSLAKASADTLRIDADGTASKQVFADEDTEMLRQELDRVNAKLAQAVKDKNKVGIVSRTDVRIDTIVKNDTVYLNDATVDVRNATIETKDYTAKIRSTPDSTRMSLSARDTVQYSIDKDFRLRAKHSWKYLKVVELESFYVKPATKRTGYKFWLGLVAGAGVMYGLSR